MIWFRGILTFDLKDAAKHFFLFILIDILDLSKEVLYVLAGQGAAKVKNSQNLQRPGIEPWSPKDQLRFH